MIPSWAKPGAKVVCVDDGPSRAGGIVWENDDALVVGATYTVRDVWIDHWGYAVADFFEKQRSPLSAIHYGVSRVGYGLYRFRPLVSRTQEQDVALFKSLLNPTLVDKLDLLAERLDHIYNE